MQLCRIGLLWRLRNIWTGDRTQGVMFEHEVSIFQSSRSAWRSWDCHHTSCVEHMPCAVWVLTSIAMQT